MDTSLSNNKVEKLQKKGYIHHIDQITHIPELFSQLIFSSNLYQALLLIMSNNDNKVETFHKRIHIFLFYFIYYSS